VDGGEDPIVALRRELYEEIEFEPSEISYFTRFDFDMSELGLSRYYRMYYVIPMAPAEQQQLILHEGRAMQAFAGEEMFSKLRLTPYDAFALLLHHARSRIGKGLPHGKTK